MEASGSSPDANLRLDPGMDAEDVAGPVQTIAKDHEMTKTTDTETEANRQTMTETFEAWRDGAEPFPDTWAADMVWRIEGRSIASKEYASKHEYLEEFVKPFGARFLASERFRPTNIRSVHANGNTVIVLWDGRGIAIDRATPLSAWQPR